MKTTLYPIALAVLFSGCNVFSGDKAKGQDSLQSYIAAPPTLEQKEFQHYYSELSSFFERGLLKSDFNGSILVSKNGAIIYEKYIGRPDLRKPDLMTDSTSLHLASTSKTFTGMAILRLVQDNLLSLQDSLSKFFPGIPYPGITVQMLLNHRSGLPNYIYFMPQNDYGKDQYVINQDVLNYLMVKQPNRSFSPNRNFSYSNTNFVLLAMIIEKVTGQTFPEFMRTKFFEPLQMKNTYVFTLADSGKATPSFEWNGHIWKYDFLEGTYGDKNIYSTPRDLLKWDQALYTDKVIRKSLLDSAFTPYSLERPSVHNYGLGWRLQMLPNGKKVIYHFGKWHGFNAAFARLTDEKVTIIILGNRFNRAIYREAHLAYDFFGDYRQGLVNKDDDDDSPESTKKLARATPKVKKPPSRHRSRPITKNR